MWSSSCICRSPIYPFYVIAFNRINEFSVLRYACHRSGESRQFFHVSRPSKKKKLHSNKLSEGTSHKKVILTNYSASSAGGHVVYNNSNWIFSLLLLSLPPPCPFKTPFFSIHLSLLDVWIAAQKSLVTSTNLSTTLAARRLNEVAVISISAKFFPTSDIIKL